MSKPLSLLAVFASLLLASCSDQDIQTTNRSSPENHEIAVTISPQQRWITSAYVDVFGEQISSYYVGLKGVLTGSYSNSAVARRPMYVKPHIDSNKTLHLRIYENYVDANGGKRHYNDKSYELRIKDASGRVHKYRGFTANVGLLSFPGGRESSHGMTIVDLLIEGHEVKFYIQGERRSVETYRFDISKSELVGLKEALMEMEE